MVIAMVAFIMMFFMVLSAIAMSATTPKATLKQNSSEE
jgi:hypothetical protein